MLYNCSPLDIYQSLKCSVKAGNQAIQSALSTPSSKEVQPNVVGWLTDNTEASTPIPG